MIVKVQAPAKINLSLDILSKRNDGYHDVSMVMQAIDLFDIITVKGDKDIKGDNISITCNDPLIPTDSSNIVCKIAKAFFTYTDTTPINLYIDIDKKIPSQAGLAGGSTDGAAVIFALNLIMDTRLKDKEMAEIGEKAGADVPFCVFGGTMHAKGIGTTLNKLPSMPKCHIVLIKPEISISTKEAYDMVDSNGAKQFVYTDELIKQICSKNIRGISSLLYNEFEQVLKNSSIIDIKKELLKEKALGASMSGSGSAVYGIFQSERKARKCFENLKEKYEKIYLCTPINYGCKVI